MVRIRTAGGESAWLPYRRAGAAGALAFLLGYGATLGAIRVGGGLEQGPARGVVEGLLDQLRLAGLVFFDAQLVTVRADLGRQVATADLLSQAPTIPAAGYYLLPIVAIAGCAWLLVATDPVRPADGGASARLGAGLVVGYLPLVVVGTEVFSARGPAVGLSADPITGIVFAGILYPTAFGALGGALAWRRAPEEGESVDSPDRGRQSRR